MGFVKNQYIIKKSAQCFTNAHVLELKWHFQPLKGVVGKRSNSAGCMS